ncbi:hypothetical protein Bca52824_074187 [Brassica carinata]|uniref:Uncharacterized protein n=1 Tax=Brassica carinata TaxID=52824 RepID=A0A8X7QFF1_BRACI|nr:hypothetical protein Bca52824_074187 [Brassica carinata]
MTSVRGLVDNPRKKEKTEMNTAPPPQGEKWCEEKVMDFSLAIHHCRRCFSAAPLYYISEESWKGFTEWALKPIPLTIGPTCFNLSQSYKSSKCWKMAWKRGDGCGYVYMACEHYIESLGPSPCCFHECYVLPPSRRCIQEVLPNKKPINCLISFLECSEESFHLMGD